MQHLQSCLPNDSASQRIQDIHTKANVQALTVVLTSKALSASLLKRASNPGLSDLYETQVNISNVVFSVLLTGHFVSFGLICSLIWLLPPTFA